jgi:hypothetical protein
MWQHMFRKPVMCTVWRREFTSPHNTHYRHTKHTLPHNHDELIVLFKYFNRFNICNIDKEINKELPEDDLLEDRNMLQCFLKCLK